MRAKVTGATLTLHGSEPPRQIGLPYLRRQVMISRYLSLLAVFGLALAGISSAQAQARPEPVKFAQCFDLTKATFFASVPLSQGARDLAQLLNQSGGIEGHPIEILVQDHGNEPQRGIECYEKMKRDGAITFDFYSTPVTKALIPRLMKDGNVLMSPFGGRSDSANGEVFKWVFPVGPTIWGQAAAKIQYIKTMSNNNLKGKKIAFMYVDYPFGQEPIPVLKTLAAREGFELQLFPHPLPGNNQAGAWTQIRRFNPDWIVAWNFSSMHVMASREMAQNGISMDKYITIGIISELDIANIGPDKAKGLKRTTNVAASADQPVVQRILKELYDKGQGSGPRERVGTTYYFWGLAGYATIFEGARLAIKQYGWPLNADKMRRGLESIRNFDANGIMAPMSVTAKDHSGGGKTRVEMWDGSKWVAQTGWFSAYDDVVQEVINRESAEYAKSNP